MTHQSLRHQPPPRVTRQLPGVRRQRRQLAQEGARRLLVGQADAGHAQRAAAGRHTYHHTWSKPHTEGGVLTRGTR
jgi:hypothetical protein